MCEELIFVESRADARRSMSIVVESKAGARRSMSIVVESKADARRSMSSCEGLIVVEYVPFIRRDGVRRCSRSLTEYQLRGFATMVVDASLSSTRIAVVDQTAAQFARQSVGSDISYGT